MTAAQRQALALATWMTIRAGHDATAADLTYLQAKGLIRIASSGMGFCATDYGVEVAVRLEAKGAL